MNIPFDCGAECIRNNENIAIFSSSSFSSSFRHDFHMLSLAWFSGVMNVKKYIEINLYGTESFVEQTLIVVVIYYSCWWYMMHVVQASASKHMKHETFTNIAVKKWAERERERALKLLPCRLPFSLTLHHHYLLSHSVLMTECLKVWCFFPLCCCYFAWWWKSRSNTQFFLSVDFRSACMLSLRTCMPRYGIYGEPLCIS